MKADETGGGRDKAPKRRKLKWQIEHLYSCEIGAGLSLQVCPIPDRPVRFFWSVFRRTASYRSDSLANSSCSDLAVATLAAEEAGRELLAEELRSDRAVPTDRRSEPWRWVCNLQWRASTKDGITFTVVQNTYQGTVCFGISDGRYVLDEAVASVSEGIERCEAFAEQSRQQTRRNLLAATVREPVSDVRAA